MNYPMISQILARAVGIEAGLLLLPMAVATFYGESRNGFFLAAATAIILFVLLRLVHPKKMTIYAREGFTSVTLSWVLLSLIGAIPLYVDGNLSYVDALFETVSGFTTTGASILSEGPQMLGKGLLFWRSFTHWLGGMGVLIFMMAVLPMAEDRSMHIMRAETNGPIAGKLVPHIRQSSMILYIIYIGMTLLEIVVLKVAGLSLYDAVIHAFGTACTGGFSNYNLSVGQFNSPVVDLIISLFMLAFAVNFNLYYMFFIRKIKNIFCNEELWWYLGMVAFATITITVNIYHLYGTALHSLRYAFFQVVSIITTTGFVTADFSHWPEFSQWMLVILMFTGACAGSTSGGIKIARFIILGKTVSNEIRRLLRPRSFTQVRLNNAVVDRDTVHSTLVYIYIYFFMMGLVCLLLSLENLDFTTVFTAAVSCLSNIGPGLSLVGPYGGFDVFSDAGKLLLTFCMLVGRLQIYPVLLTLAAFFQKQK